ncbi:leucine-rich repeat domain-containing protein [Akkermansiaceae bacterium]|nr:leucine-rich repeat domain-containing protein [Akkermansiaceae bacterium]MDB4521639.1 leucine-rich repeat domain-containing protein [Akkermansiaceae bacterium]
MKHLIPLQALLALFACAFLPLHAASLADLTFTTAGGKVTITDCDSAATGELIIPSIIEGNPVTSIGDGAFGYCRSLTSITIPDSVTSIEKRAFTYCTSLTRVTIPDGVNSIERWTFRNCTSLTSITIPDSVTSIGDSAFGYCESLTSITIPDSVTSIGNDAFLACSSLTDVMIGNGVTSIRFGAFRGCTSLTNIFMEGPPPFVEFLAFGEVAPNALVNVKPEWRDNYGAAGDTWYGLIITETEEECDNEELATLVALLAQKDAQIAELEKRPTQNQYDQVVAELDARPSLEDIQEARAGSVVLTPTGNGTVILRMMIEKSSDLSVWENSEESVEVELPLTEGKKFLRFALK